MNRAPSEFRKETNAAILSGLPTRLSGTFAGRVARTFRDTIGVEIEPGQMQFTRTPEAASSRAITLVNMTTAALALQ